VIKPETVQQIKEAARVEDVVGEFVRLKKRGTNLIGLCPFHDEKTPSFNVNVARNIYKCFGCGKAGDPISFLQEHEHLSFVESLRWLAKRYQIEIEEEARTPEQEAAQDHREALQIANRWAADWFAQQLRESEEGRAVGMAYCKERGMLQKTIETFGLGWCPEGGEAFLKAATEAGYKPEFLVELGLVKEREGRRYDFYRGRLMFPIHNLSGKVIGFGGRTLKSGPRIPKYVNSPESVLYNKRQVLYGLHQAKRAIIKEERCFMVEGYTDVLSLHQAGIENVVASSGTALTPDQVRLVKRYTPNLTILYDGDAAGLNAAMRGTEIVLAEGMNVRIVRLPDGEDPDSLVQARGADGMLEFLDESATDFVLFKTQRLLEGVGNDPMRKAAAVQDVVSTIALVGDPIARAFYVKETARLMELSEQLLLTETNKALQHRMRKKRESEARQRGQTPPPPGLESLPPRVASGQVAGQALPDGVDAPPPGSIDVDPNKAAQESRLERVHHRELDLIRLLFESEGHLVDDQPAVPFILDQVADVDVDHPVYRKILQAYRQAMEIGEVLTTKFFLQHENEAIKSLAIDILHKPYELSPNWTKKHDIAITDKRFLVRRDVEKVVAYLKVRKIDGLIKEVAAQMQALHRKTIYPTREEVEAAEKAAQERGEEPPKTEDQMEAERLLQLYQRLKQAKQDLAEAAAHTLVDRK
jgi:DNA primase